MNRSFRSLLVIAGIASSIGLTSTVVLADDSAASTPTVGQPQGEQGGHLNSPRHRRMHRRFVRLAKRLELTDQQKAQAKELFKNGRAQAKPLFVRFVAEKHQLRNLIESGNADETAIRAQSAKVAAIGADLAVHRGQMAKRFQALLTPDQQTKLKALQAKRETRFQEFLNQAEGPTED